MTSDDKSALNSPLLVVRSDFSIGDSILSVEQAVEQAAEAGLTHLAIADTMTVSGIVKFTSLCKAKGIHPVIGCRLRVVQDASYRHGKSKAPPEVCPMVWPRNEDGFKDLLHMLTLGTDADHFYYKPRLSVDEVVRFVNDGDLILTTGDLNSLVENQEMFDYVVKEIEPGYFWRQYVEHSGPYFKAINNVKHLEARYGGAITTYPALYPKGKAEAYDVMNAVSRRATIKQPWRHIIHYRDLHPQAVEGIEHDNNAFVATLRYQFQKMDVSLPDMGDGKRSEFDILKEKCTQGWRTRLTRPIMGFQPTAHQQVEYTKRLITELKVIKDMKFERYFLLVEDLVRWSKDNGIIVGPGRGSVGGSLVAYLLGITDVDPLRFGLLFERFINPDRLDLPDADLDFQSSRRGEVIEYLKNRYGTDRVAGISNYNSIVSKGAIRDVGRVFEVPPKVLFISKLVPDTYGQSHTLEQAFEEVAAIQEFAERNPDVWRNATALQGVQRSLGRHAAGVVVAGEPLITRAVVDYSKDEPAVNWDKRVVEDLGLVKMDILGLSNLDVLKTALGYLKERGIELDLNDIPLDDKATLEAFTRAETVGVFQFESGGMRKLLKDLAMGGETLTFDDMVAATSLYRPGPKDSGLLDDYVAIKQGLKAPSYEHPALEDALKETHGVIIYQEQVMAIARLLCGFSGADADHIRKAMGKKDPEKMKEWRERFVKGANEFGGMAESRANALFDKIETFAGYGFNKSHAVEYSIISFWTLYMKTHYPAEFFAAALSVLKEEKLEGLVSDAATHGVEILPPDINKSTDRFEIDRDWTRVRLITPFNRVKQISDKTASHIIEVRNADGPFKSFDDLEARTTGRTFNKRHKENLHKVGAFCEFYPDEPGPLDESRRRDQVELMPGLIIAPIRAERDLTVDAEAKNRLINEVIRPCQECDGCDLAGGVHPIPRLGGHATFMVVTDCPNFSEEADNKMLSGKASNYVRDALAQNEIPIGRGYFTSLVKSPKNDKMLSNDQINACHKWLDKEIEILRPPVIVLLGNSAVKHLAPGVKPGIENAGRVIYDADKDASIVIGFNPAAITFDSSKQDTLNEVFQKVAEMIE